MCEDSPRPQATSPGQRKARAIVRKYRRNVRYAQLHRLKSLVPAVAEREEASEMEVLQETVRYIEELERRLLARVRLTGQLPARLQKLDPSTTATATTIQLPGSLENPGHSCSSSLGGGGGSLEIQELRQLLHHSLQPALEQKLKKQKSEDEAVIRRLVAETCSSSAPTAVRSHP